MKAYPDFRKGMIAMRSWLLGRDYTSALTAMNMAMEAHTGVRKDGYTPEFEHQMSVTYYLRTVHSMLLHPEETITVGFLHDSTEDGRMRLGDIEMFGPRVTDAVDRLNKRGKTDAEYYRMLGHCPISSIVKASDRIHNLQSMLGVFDADKQKEYATFTSNFVLPMIKESQQRFPGQFDAYENAKHILKCQLDFLRRLNA